MRLWFLWLWQWYCEGRMMADCMERLGPHQLGAPGCSCPRREP